MHWILMLLGAVIGAAIGDADEAMLGLVLGGLLGWQQARLSQLRLRVQALEQARTPAREAQPGSATPAAHTSAPMAASAPAASLDRVAAAAPRPVPAPAAALGTGAATPADRPPMSAAAPGSAAPQRGAQPSALARLLRRLLFEGNVPAKAGALVLFFGLAALLKLASVEGWLYVPLEWRLLGVAVAAIVAVGWGWRNRTARPAFGLSMQGLGIGVLLLTVFAGYRLYDLLPAGFAFALVAVLVAAAAALAVLQQAMWLALIGFVGGYLAPLLLSTGSGNHVALFSWYALLDAAVFGIAWVRAWRALNLVGFGFTFGVATLWGWQAWRPEHFATAEPFLVLFFLFYVAIPVLYAWRQPTARRGLVDGTLVFGTPLIAFPLQAAMLQGQPMALAYSALAVALLYALLAAWLLRPAARAPLLGQSFAALAIGFATLAVPLALSARTTAATWALEGAALVWLGLRQHQRWPLFAGWLLQGLAAAAWLVVLFDGGFERLPGEWPLANGAALGVLLMALSAFFISACHDGRVVDDAPRHRLLAWPPFLLGLGWWHVLVVREVAAHAGSAGAERAIVAWLAASLVLAALLRTLLRWPRLGWLVVYGCGLAALAAVAALVADEGVLRLPWLPYWLGLLAALAFALTQLVQPLQKGISIAHVAVLWTLSILLGGGLQHESGRAELGDGWTWAAATLPLAVLLVGSWRRPGWFTRPLQAVFPLYRLRWWIPAACVLALAWVTALRLPGDATPLPFVPVLNPLELLQLALLLVAWRALRALADADVGRTLRGLLAIAGFAFASMAGLRAVHHWTGASWSPALLGDGTAQATLTVLWSIGGVLAWVLGSRRQSFPLWRIGALLMAVVLAKLAFLDRAYMGNVAGVVSFMAVGLLLVLVGRIAPSPPRTART